MRKIFAIENIVTFLFTVILIGLEVYMFKHTSDSTFLIINGAMSLSSIVMIMYSK